MRYCKVCGRTDNDHHEPDWIEIPAGCVCDWREWDYHKMSKLPLVCSEYEGDGTTNCQTCEHDKECHTHNSRISGADNTR